MPDGRMTHGDQEVDHPWWRSDWRAEQGPYFSPSVRWQIFVSMFAIWEKLITRKRIILGIVTSLNIET